jgi:ABC-2 type transport system ATP-binding protein
MLEIRNLVKTFGETRALDDLSFTVREGAAFGLLGRNGAGKTTCIRIIMNIFKADSGSVLIDGIPAHKAKVKIGYLPEERGLYQKRTILEQMVYIGKLRGLSATDAVKNTKDRLEELEATEYMKRKLDTLSKGNQQKIQLAIALLSDPDVIILDEPFSGLDPVNAMLLKNIVRRQVQLGKTVIFSSHQMAQVEEFCDDICLIHKGREVLEGNLAQIKRSYPRNTIHVEFADGVSVDVPAFINAKLGLPEASVLKKSDGWYVTLGTPAQKEELFRAFDEAGFVPDLFAVKEPTLEEIFIERTGSVAEPETIPEEDGPKRNRSLFGRNSRRGGARK